MITLTMMLTSYDDNLYFQLMNFIKPGTCDMKKVVDKVKLDSLACQKQHFEVSSLLVWNISMGKVVQIKFDQINAKIDYSDYIDGHYLEWSDVG